MMENKRQNKILISGLPRSGSTLLGNIIGSGQNVEYFFEPPIISPLLSVINELEPKTFRLLFDSYVENELLLPALAGRRINFNKNDDSYVYRYKSEEEIEARLKNSWRSSDLRIEADKFHIAFKTPGISSALVKFMQYYPDWKLVVIFRKYEDILASILVKGWFDDKSPHTITPFKFFGKSKVPVSIPEKWKAPWSGFSPTERAMIYMNEQLSAMRLLDNYMRVNYENIIHDFTEINRLFAQLNLPFTEKTHELIDGIYVRKGIESNLNFKITNPEVLEEVQSHKDFFGI